MQTGERDVGGETAVIMSLDRLCANARAVATASSIRWSRATSRRQLYLHIIIIIIIAASRVISII